MPWGDRWWTTRGEQALCDLTSGWSARTLALALSLLYFCLGCSGGVRSVRGTDKMSNTPRDIARLSTTRAMMCGEAKVDSSFLPLDSSDCATFGQTLQSSGVSFRTHGAASATTAGSIAFIPPHSHGSSSQWAGRQPTLGYRTHAASHSEFTAEQPYHAFQDGFRPQDSHQFHSLSMGADFWNLVGSPTRGRVGETSCSTWGYGGAQALQAMRVPAFKEEMPSRLPLIITIGPQCSGKTTTLRSFESSMLERGNWRLQDIAIDDHPNVYHTIPMEALLRDPWGQQQPGGGGWEGRGVAPGAQERAVLVHGRSVEWRLRDRACHESRLVALRLLGRMTEAEFSAEAAGLYLGSEPGAWARGVGGAFDNSKAQ
ncbi:unnamed protein product, partial [Choristocarpus tenellus]